MYCLSGNNIFLLSPKGTFTNNILAECLYLKILDPTNSFSYHCVKQLPIYSGSVAVLKEVNDGQMAIF